MQKVYEVQQGPKKGSKTPEKGVDREYCHITTHPGKKNQWVLFPYES